ncbi:MAG TPA: DUF1569 domain-containing protein [Gemmatimonadaceae bacterium]|nr:DUF1569 domain-containing protein [Gemmatimonadaceae bacterium]
MPALLHDPAVRTAIRQRIASLRPDSVRRWGKMTVDQMLWHCNQGMGQALGTVPSVPLKAPIPRSLMKIAVFNLPWPRGAPTAPELTAGDQRFDLESERARCLSLIDQVAARSMDSGGWGPSPAFGHMTGFEWSRLMAKHFDHHLRQFSA